MRDYEKFFTPPDVADFMASLLDAEFNDTVLDACAGIGALAIAVKKTNHLTKITGVEINEQHKQELHETCDEVVIQDILQYTPYKLFHNCISNPPFGNGIDLDAIIEKIKSLTIIGGKVVILVPKYFEPKFIHKAHHIENWSKNSDGTTTEIKIIEFFNNADHTTFNAEISERMQSDAWNEVLKNKREKNFYGNEHSELKKKYLGNLYYGIENTSLGKALNNMLNRTLPIWKDVQDELPTESGRYWCFVEEINDLGKSYFQWNCAYDVYNDQWSDSTLKNGEKVTHWMPLAQPPFNFQP